MLCVLLNQLDFLYQQIVLYTLMGGNIYTFLPSPRPKEHIVERIFNISGYVRSVPQWCTLYIVQLCTPKFNNSCSSFQFHNANLTMYIDENINQKC